MDTLPEELYAELYRVSDMETFKSLSLVSKTLRADCQRLIFRRRVVHVSPNEWSNLRDSVDCEDETMSELFSSGCDSIVREVRHLVVVCDTGRQGEQPELGAPSPVRYDILKILKCLKSYRRDAHQPAVSLVCLARRYVWLVSRIDADGHGQLFRDPCDPYWRLLRLGLDRQEVSVFG